MLHIGKITGSWKHAELKSSGGVCKCQLGVCQCAGESAAASWPAYMNVQHPSSGRSIPRLYARFTSRVRAGIRPRTNPARAKAYERAARQIKVIAYSYVSMRSDVRASSFRIPRAEGKR